MGNKAEFGQFHKKISQIFRSKGIEPNEEAILDLEAYLFRELQHEVCPRKQIQEEINHTNKDLIAENQQKEIAYRYLQAHTKAQQLLLQSGETIPFQEFITIIGKAAGASRGYIFVNNWDEHQYRRASQLAEYTAPGTTPQTDNPELQNMAYTEFSPRWEQYLSAGEKITGSIRNFPENERKKLEKQGIINILILPVFANNNFWGFIGFDNCHTDIPWSATETENLQSAVLTLASKIEREQERKENQQRDEQFRHMIEKASDSYAVFDANLSLMFFSPAFTEQTDFTLDEYPKEIKAVLNHIHPEEREKIWEQIDEAIEQQRHHLEITYRHVHKEGHYIWREDRIRLFYDDKGNFNGALLIGRDITRRKQMEQALRDSEARFSTLFEKTFHPIVVTDTSGRIVLFNEMAYKTLGYSKDEYTGKCLSHFDAYRNADELQALLHTIRKDSRKSFYTQHRTRKGSLRELIAKASVIPFSGQTMLLFSFHDITELRQAQQAYQQSESRYRFLFEVMTQGVVCHHPDGQVTDANQAAARLLGLSLEQLQGKKSTDPGWKSIHEDGSAFPGDTHPAMGTIKTGKPVLNKRMGVFNPAENKYRWLNISSHPHCNDKQELTEVIVTFEDITDLYELNATKDQFFSIIAHDLKNPMNTILGFSELLEKNYRKYDEAELGKQIGTVNRKAKHTYRLLENLLTWSRLQRGRLKFQPITLNLHDLAKETIVHVSDAAAKKDINLHMNISQNIYLHADAHMLSTAIRNLMNNAIKFTEANGYVSLAAKTEEQPNPLAIITVTDNGLGIKEERINTLFSIEENKSSPGTNNEKGTGLGLILVKEFVEKQGGHIWVTSQPGKGTTFSFTIPLAHAAKENTPKPDEFSPAFINDLQELFTEKQEELYYPVKQEILPVYREARKTNSIKAIKQFAVALKDMGENHSLPQLIHWHDTIQEAADKFAVKKISRHLELFDQIADVNKLKNA